jgi:ribulose-phosphate 3-epimerase
MHLKIAPSIISADFSILQEEVQEVEKGGADLLHIDVYPLLVWGFEYRRLGRMMIGPLLVEVLKNHTRLPLDVHLAIEVSDDVIRRYVRAGSDIITVHAEACAHPERVIRMIKDQGLKAGIALNPATPLSLVKPYLTDLDLILLMTTSANFGGLDFTADTIPKIRMAAALRKRHRSMLDIVVDGSVDCKSAPKLVAAGANVLVAGGAIFGEKDYADAIRKLRHACRRKLTAR